MMTTRHIDRWQGETDDDTPFGYLHIGDGGLYFTWRYDRRAARRAQITQVVETLEPDTVDPPTGRWSYRSIARALRAHIRRHGLLQFHTTGAY